MAKPILKLEPSQDSENKIYIRKFMKQAHQILYESENIEGESALNDIMHFIFLRLLEGKISDKPEIGKIDLKNPEYYENISSITNDDFEYFNVENIANEDLKMIRDKETNDIIKRLGKVFHYHPVMSNIYNEYNFIKSEKPGTIQNLLNSCILKIDMKKFKETDDAIGVIYEDFINGYHKSGSKLGQYFTPRNMMHLTLNFLKPTLEKKIAKVNEYSVSDWCMGTAGWLINFYNMFKNDYSDKILLSGGDVKSSTFQFGLMNIISTIDKLPHKIIRDNCLTHIDDEKYDLILTNPPFRTDFNFKNIESNFTLDGYTKENKIELNDVYKLKHNKPTVQFLELCIYKLKEKGLCVIVLPFGELFFGKIMKKVRKYLIDNVNIKYIIEFESGIFTHTGIKTAIIVFEKVKGTKQIQFLKANEECNELYELGIVDKFNDNYSFYSKDYFMVENEISNEFEMIPFEEVFELEKGKIQSSKVKEDENGEGVFVTIAEHNFWKKYEKNKCKIFGENMFISCVKPVGKILYYEGFCDFSNLLYLLKIKEKYKYKINIKFYYHYLKNKQNFIEENFQVGSCNKKLDADNFNKMNIPIPTIEIQNEIVKKLDRLSSALKVSKEQINNYSELINIYINNEIFTNKCETKKIKDICKFLPKSKRNASFGKDDGTYNFYTSSEKIKKCDVADYNEEALIIGTGGNINIHIAKNFSCSADNFIITHKNIWYIYYFLMGNLNILDDGFKGATIKHISKEYMEEMNIPIPTIEIQNEIVKKCDKIQKLIDNIKEMNKFIENQKINILKTFN